MKTVFLTVGWNVGCNQAQKAPCFLIKCFQRNLIGIKHLAGPHTENKKAQTQSFLIQSVLLTHFAEHLRHLKRSRGVHVGGDDGDASVRVFGVAECEGPLKVNLRGNKSGHLLDSSMMWLFGASDVYVFTSALHRHSRTISQAITSFLMHKFARMLRSMVDYNKWRQHSEIQQSHSGCFG